MSERLRATSILVVALACAPACLPNHEHDEPAGTGGPVPTAPRVLTQTPVPLVPPRPPASPPTRPRPEVAVIYSSDVRGRVSPTEIPRPLPPGVTLAPLAARESTGGLARRATHVDRARLEAGGVVQVDAGDFLPLPADAPDPAAAGPKAFERGVDLLLNAYRRLGVDAVTLGERELAAPKDLAKLAKRLAAAKLRVLVANLVDHKGKPVFPGDALIDAGGVKVGLLGVTELVDPEPLTKAGYTLGDARAAAVASARDLRARGAKLVIALVHAPGTLRSRALAEGISEIDFVIANHHAEENLVPPPSPPRPHVVTASHAGRLDVRMTPASEPDFEDRELKLGKEVPLELGVDLLTRVPTIPMIDTKKMEAAMAHGDKRIKMRDLYESWDYGSTKACGFCHKQQVAQWQTTDHAHAYATLKRKKQEKNPACLGCHVMGFLQPGGTRDIVMVESGFAEVGCEACHGPSAEHVRSLDKKKGTSRKVDPIICLGCHTPDQNVADFDPVAAMKEIVGPGHGVPGATPTSDMQAAPPDAKP
jgi:hypothetical protein